MKKILFLVSVFITISTVGYADNILINTTSKDMLCFEEYPTIYKQNFKMPHEEYIVILKPKSSIVKKREGYIHCYNEIEGISWYKNGNIQKTNEYTLLSLQKQHELFDLSKYENKNRAYVDNTFYNAQKCVPYKNGQYCNYFFGLDIIFDKNKHVSTIILYRNTVDNGALPLKPESIMKLRTNSEPLGLWVKNSYKKLFAKKPAIISKNMIQWKNLSPYIKKVSMTTKRINSLPKQGQELFYNYDNLNKDENNIQSIIIEYK